MTFILNGHLLINIYFICQSPEMSYFTTKEPVIYYPEPMHIVWEKENGEILSNESEVTVQSQVKTEPTPSDHPTIKVTSEVIQDETQPSHECIVSMNKPHTNLTTKEDEVKDFLKEPQILQIQIQDFKQLITEMRSIKNQIYDMVQHMDYHIDMLIDIKGVSNKVPKLECIICGNEFCNCSSNRDCTHLVEIVLPLFKKKKVTSTNMCLNL